jgi:lipopolysaccharide biosynthesis protein
MSERNKLRTVAFYLPQFHPIPENNAWWGEGFTEWTNVTKAKPLFPGHYQPHLPADLGFYDLRVPEVRHQQAALAKQYGVDAFCYHYYWFSGRRLLNRPLDDMLADRKFEMPFCLCWANENWTRRWDGAAHELLMAQKHEPGDEERFIEDLLPFLRDPRYLQLDGAPLLIVYAPQQLPDPQASVAKWRAAAAQHGIARLHLCAALTHGTQSVMHWGFDSAVEFPPHNQRTPGIAHRVEFDAAHTGSVFDYAAFARAYLERSYDDPRVHRTVVPSWDNTARTGPRAVMLVNATPQNFAAWAQRTWRATQASLQPSEQGLMFVNAWNEWAEGCHLEPDREHGHAYLEALAAARNDAGALMPFGELGDARIGVVHHSLRRALSLALRANARSSVSHLREFVKARPLLKRALLAVLRALRLRS